MPPEDIVRAQVDEHTKAEASAVLERMGLSVSDAIRLLLEQIARDKTLPLGLEVPNKTTMATFEATDRGEDVVHCENADDLFRKLGL
jgi:DNA-damage-inducible protein J